MACATKRCEQVEAVVKRWMDEHPELAYALWDVFDVQGSIDVVVSVHRDGVRQLSLKIVESTLTRDHESQILDWLNNLADQPAIQA
ncbi:MAG: hypothetical protein ABSH50_28310 [Bryobacteraceae bacterium]|jgi:hypothetical protein